MRLETCFCHACHDYLPNSPLRSYNLHTVGRLSRAQQSVLAHHAQFIPGSSQEEPDFARELSMEWLGVLPPCGALNHIPLENDTSYEVWCGDLNECLVLVCSLGKKIKFISAHNHLASAHKL